MKKEQEEELISQIKLQNLSYACAGYKLALVDICKQSLLGRPVRDIVSELNNISQEQLEAKINDSLKHYEKRTGI